MATLNPGGTKTTRAEEVSQCIAEDIVERRLAPGVALDESEIASRYGVSRTPVREAIRNLAAIGLVKIRPHRSAIVTQPSAEQLRDMFEVMAELEALCAARAANNMSEAQHEALQCVHHELAEVVKNDDVRRYQMVNDEFHNAIYAGSGNEYLRQTTLATRARLAPFRRSQFLSSGRLEKSYREHQEILGALLARDAVAAANCMRQHILVVEDTYERMSGIEPQNSAR